MKVGYLYYDHYNLYLRLGRYIYPQSGYCISISSSLVKVESISMQIIMTIGMLDWIADTQLKDTPMKRYSRYEPVVSNKYQYWLIHIKDRITISGDFDIVIYL